MSKNQEMNLAALEDRIAQQDELIEHLKSEIERLTNELDVAKAAKPAVGGRKYEVLQVLREGAVSITAIAERLNTTSKNVSSTLTALRKEGAEIMTDSRGQKILVDESETLKATYPAN